MLSHLQLKLSKQFFQPGFDKPWNILNLAGLAAEKQEDED